MRTARRLTLPRAMSERTQADYRSSDPHAQIASIVAAWTQAWNAHDAAALAGLVAADVDFVNVAGRWLQGAEEFRQWHRMIHQTHLRRSIWTTRHYRLRALAGDLALVHLEWSIDGELGPDGDRKPQRNGIFTWLAAPRGGSWLIIAAHNTNLADGVLHRLANNAPL
jgi:uncharacterized protein (TIGR02246 family)